VSTSQETSVSGHTTSEARLRQVLENCRRFLTDKKIGQYQYMEGSGFYEDRDTVVAEIDDVLSDETVTGEKR